MDAAQEERRGEDARQVLDSYIYKEAYATIEANILTAMANANTTPEQGEYQRKLLIALRKVRIYIEQVAVTGTMAAIAEERKRTFMERQVERFTRRA
jgi:hypothetical protein